MADHDVQVQVRFTVEEDGYPPFTDALYYPIDEWPVSAKQVEADKAERFAAFKAAIDTPAEPDPVAPGDRPGVAEIVQTAMDALATAQTALAAAGDTPPAGS